MSGYLLPPLRKALQDYTRSCEHLLSSATVLAFTVDELDIMMYYTAEVTKMVSERAGLNMNPTDISLHNNGGTA